MSEEPESAPNPERRDEIVDAALEEFASEGFRGATIKRIARRAQAAVTRADLLVLLLEGGAVPSRSRTPPADPAAHARPQCARRPTA